MHSLSAPSRKRAISLLRVGVAGWLGAGAWLAHADDLQYSNTNRHVSAQSYLVDPAAPPDQPWIEVHSDGYSTHDYLPIERTALANSSRGAAVGLATATQASTIDPGGLSATGRAHHFIADGSSFSAVAIAESEVEAHFYVAQRRLAKLDISVAIPPDDHRAISVVYLSGPGVSIEVFADEYAPSIIQHERFFMAPGNYGLGALASTYIDNAASSTATFEFRLVTHLIGDMNCDGAFNVFDLDAFWMALYMPAAYGLQYGADCDIELGDINMDGGVNRNDIDPFVALLIGG